MADLAVTALRPAVKGWLSAVSVLWPGVGAVSWWLPAVSERRRMIIMSRIKFTLFSRLILFALAAVRLHRR
jgi:hypothetical protein